MKKTTPKVPPKKDRRGWPKNKPRKPKLTTEVTPEEQEAIRKAKAPPFIYATDGIVTGQSAFYPHNMGETIRQMPGKPPAKLGAEWQFMDLDEWRSNPTCVEYIQKLHAEPMFRRFLGMLHSYASRTRAETPQNETSASNFLGRIQGRRDILEVIDVAAIPNEPIVNPTDFPTFTDQGEPMGII